MKNFKKYIEAIAQTVFWLALIATGVALAIFLSGRGEVINNSVQMVLWYFLIGEFGYVAYLLVKLQLNQK
jgi:hypothetical protein